MPYTNINHVLNEKLEPEGEITIPYPAGKNQGSFFGAFNHNLAIEDSFYRAPKDFVVVTEAEQIRVHWRNKRVVEAGSILYIRLEELGTNLYFDEATGTLVQQTVPSHLFMVNLQAPKQKHRSWYVTPCNIESGGDLPLEHAKPDVPRNVTILSSANDTDRLFVVRGKDMYDRPMAEHIMGPNAGVRHGKKAFASVRSISVDDACKGEIAIGYGNRLGLPTYLPAEGYLMKVLVNGSEPPKGMVRTGFTGVPGAATGDVRGTYTPSPAVPMDGRHAIYLLISLPNPGNIGAPDYTE